MQLDKTTPNSLTSPRVCQQSPQALTPQSQNAVLISNQEAVRTAGFIPSVFGNMPAATPREVGEVLATLAACFPQMPSLFWGLAAKQITKQCLSKPRLDHIAEQLMMTHRYPTLTMADMFALDRPIRTFTYAECQTMPEDHEPLATIRFGGKCYIVRKTEAEQAGYEYQPFETEAERSKRIARESEEKWKREWEAMTEQEKEETMQKIQRVHKMLKL